MKMSGSAPMAWATSKGRPRPRAHARGVSRSMGVEAQISATLSRGPDRLTALEGDGGGVRRRQEPSIKPRLVHSSRRRLFLWLSPKSADSSKNIQDTASAARPLAPHLKQVKPSPLLQNLAVWRLHLVWRALQWGHSTFPPRLSL